MNLRYLLIYLFDMRILTDFTISGHHAGDVGAGGGGGTVEISVRI